MISISTISLKIVVVGDYAVGKTCCIHRYIDNRFIGNYIPTLGFEISVKTIKIAGKIVVFSIWDMGAQQCYEPTNYRYYDGSRGFIMVYDLTNQESFLNLDHWIVDIKEACPKASIILVGNKADMPERAITETEIQKKASEYDANGYVTTSAKTGMGIKETFNLLGLSILQRFKLI